MIAEFVERRGGGLLMLGGARSFSEGGYAGTPVADALPVVARRVARARHVAALAREGPADPRRRRARARADRADRSGVAQRWNDLPTLISVNAIKGVKPGATVLLTGTDEPRAHAAVLAFQRYGRGKAIAFTVLDSWRWQMHASIPLEDMTHENYWRQLLRWLVDGVPGPVEVHVGGSRRSRASRSSITADVVDDTFVELNDAQVVRQGHDAGRRDRRADAVDRRAQRPVSRHVRVGAEEAGDTAEVEASRGGKALGDGSDARARGAGRRRVFRRDDARRAAAADRRRNRRPVLHRRRPGALAEDLKYTGRGVTTVEERDLWHMPIVLLLLVGLTCAEWGYRRAVGLA